MNEDLGKLLEADPLATAEAFGRLCGLDYDDVSGLGLMMHISHRMRLNGALLEAGDTTLSNELQCYVDVITSMGFELVLDVPFMSTPWREEPVVQEHQFFYARRDGLLLIFDTYHCNAVNSAKVYYSWKPHPEFDRRAHSVTSSGGYRSNQDWPEHGLPDDAFWFGDHDGREALRYKIKGLEDNGQFLAPWPASKSPKWVWALNYADLKKNDGSLDTHAYGSPEYKAVMRSGYERLLRLPQWVQDMIVVDQLDQM